MRSAEQGDQGVLYEVCLRTGASGGDASDQFADHDLLGSVYVGPYLLLEPRFAFVAEDDDGVAGYVLGVAHTTAFEQACERHWWPSLRHRYPLDAFPEGSRDARVVRLIHNPWARADAVVAEYPAHLHIDLLPRIQGQGIGRRLLTTLFEALTGAGVGGVHLGVGLANRRAIGFYRRMGFTEVQRFPDAMIMARKL